MVQPSEDITETGYGVKRETEWLSFRPNDCRAQTRNSNSPSQKLGIRVRDLRQSVACGGTERKWRASLMGRHVGPHARGVNKMERGMRQTQKDEQKLKESPQT